MRTRPGTPYPLGATWDGHGVNVAVFSEQATSVELCLFDSPHAKTEWAKVALTERDNDVWHVLRRRTFFQGRRLRGSEIKDIAWFSPAGREISDEEWAAGRVRCLGVRLAGDAIEEVGPRGERIVDETLLIVLNAGSEAMRFVMPAHRKGTRWVGLLDTSNDLPSTRWRIARGGSTVTLPDRSVMVWRLAARGSGGDHRSASPPVP